MSGVLQTPYSFVRPMISFSTCWNSYAHSTGDAMLREIKTKLGFELIELDHGVRSSLMPGIQQIFDTGEIRFSSLHNFCLLPTQAAVLRPTVTDFQPRQPRNASAPSRKRFRRLISPRN